jgi:hypothetical protein
MVCSRQHELFRFSFFILAFLATLTWWGFSLAQTKQGQRLLFQAESTVLQVTGINGKPVASMSAGAGTLIVFHDVINGLPIFVAFAEAPDWKVRGQYGVDRDKPKNNGRIIYKQIDNAIGIPYLVATPEGTRTYYLRYLELTTVGVEGIGYDAYAVKAVAFDNKVEMPSKTTESYAVPEGGQLAIVKGKIKFGEANIKPNYDLSGKLE